MYTRCPECQTAFKITVAHLKARDGLVRCGRCDSIFRADFRLFAAPAGGARAEPAPETPIIFTPEPADETGDEQTRARANTDIPVVYDVSVFYVPRRGPPTIVWALGALVAATLLSAQFAYFYRNELALLPQARPLLTRFCDMLRETQLLGCELATPASALLPELIQTRIAPHPRYTSALRLRVSIVNRTNDAQPLPLMEVSLTDHNGQLLARRTFTPHEYLETPADAALPLDPHVVLHALLDFTDPDGKAVGYEVQLFPQQSARAN